MKSLLESLQNPFESVSEGFLCKIGPKLSQINREEYFGDEENRGFSGLLTGSDVDVRGHIIDNQQIKSLFITISEAPTEAVFQPSSAVCLGRKWQHSYTSEMKQVIV